MKAVYHVSVDGEDIVFETEEKRAGYNTKMQNGYMNCIWLSIPAAKKN